MCHESIHNVIQILSDYYSIINVACSFSISVNVFTRMNSSNNGLMCFIKNVIVKIQAGGTTGVSVIK